MKPMLITLVAGLPAIFYGIWALVRFKNIGQEIAVAQNKVADLQLPGGEGFNEYEMGLFNSMIRGHPVSGVPSETSVRAIRVGWHLKWSQRAMGFWVLINCVTYWIVAR